MEEYERGETSFPIEDELMLKAERDDGRKRFLCFLHPQKSFSHMGSIYAASTVMLAKVEGSISC